MEITGRFRRSWVVAVFALAIGDPLSLDARESCSLRQDVSADVKTEPRALPPVQSRANFEAFISARYPQLTRRKVGGTPVFRVWFDSHGCVARAKLDIVSGTPDDILGSTNLSKSLVGSGGRPQYSGVGTVVTPANTIVVLFAGSNSRALDRALAMRYFTRVRRTPVSSRATGSRMADAHRTESSNSCPEAGSAPAPSNL
jgi:hypothetical protein